LTTAQLSIIRNTSTQGPLLSSQAVLTPLQIAALTFTDSSTKNVNVPDNVFSTLQAELHALADSLEEGSKEDQVQNMLVEAAAVVATYNMVSRFLVSLDVAGMSDELPPWPVDRQEVSSFA